MLDNLSKYVYEVYRCKSVSAAAKKLYISQPALSASIKKAEKALGAEIFNRKTLPFSLTAEGKVYIEAIEKVLQAEEQMYSRIRDMHEIKGGTLNIATGSNFAHYVIPKICEQFCIKYPYVNINIIATKTPELPQMLEKDTADLIFTFTDAGLHNMVVENLFRERLVIAVRRDFKEIEALVDHALSHREIVSGDFPKSKEVSDMEIFRGIEFIYSPKNSNIYKKRRMIFGTSDDEPYIITSNTMNQKLNYNLMQSGFGALLTTDADIATMPPNDNCVYFALKNPEAQQNFMIAYKKSDFSPSMKIIHEFTEISKEFFRTGNPLEKII